MTVLNLSTATSALLGKNKTTLAEFLATEAGVKNVAVAMRDNGSKINGTLVFIGFEGNTGVTVGDVVDTRNGQNKRPLGVHTVLAVVLADGKVLQDEAFTVDVDTIKAAAFIAV